MMNRTRTHHAGFSTRSPQHHVARYQPKIGGHPKMQEKVLFSNIELDAMPCVEPEQVSTTTMTLDLTTICPFDCLGCIEHHAMQQSGRTSLTVDTVYNLIENFMRHGGRKIYFYGGEPTAHADFSAIVQYAAQYAEEIVIVTNGAYLHKPHIIDAIAQAAAKTLVWVRVSLNAGTEATHNQLHRVQGIFARIVEGMATLTSTSRQVKLAVSFLVQEQNVPEIMGAYQIASAVGAAVLTLRPMTHEHGIEMSNLSPEHRSQIIDTVNSIRTLAMFATPGVQIEEWYLQWLQSQQLPDMTKPYPKCYFCAASRLIVSPPDPGIVWACPYWRADGRFLVADLRATPFYSEAFEQQRIAAIQRIHPAVDCRDVICNRDQYNKAIWQHLTCSGKVA